MSQPIDAVSQLLVSTQNALINSPLMAKSLMQQAELQKEAKQTLLNPVIQNLLILGNTRIQFTTQEVMALLGRMNPNGVSFELMRNFPASQLSPRQVALRDYLVSNPVFFRRVAQLAPPEGVINAVDVARFASAIAKAEVGTRPIRTIPAQNSATNTDSNDRPRPNTIANEIQNQRITFAELSQVARNNFIAAPNFTDKIATAPQAILRSNQPDISKNELVRALASVYLPQPSKSTDIREVEDETYRVQAIGKGVGSKGLYTGNYVKPYIIHHHNVELTGNDLLKAFRAVAGKRDEITLEQLREFETQDKEISKTLGVLRQLHVFEQLAHMDHVDHTLSRKDILMATQDHEFIVEDEHLTLIIKPIKALKK